MTDSSLSQAEADALLAIKKHRTNTVEWEYPSLGRRIMVPLVSTNKKERFFLDLRRGRIDLHKGTYQNRARNVVILARLDFGGAPHRNPNGKEIGSPHLHLYRDGFGDRWAIPAPLDRFTNLQDPWLTLDEFMLYCNIVEPPAIQRGLFT